MTSIQSQVERYVSTLPRALRQEFARYQGLRSRKRSHSSKGPGPYWKALPAWLEHRYEKGHGHPVLAQGFIRDISWAQHALFLFIKLQDDVFDGDVESRGIIYLADQFLLEADRVLSKHFPRSSVFWVTYRHCLKKCTRSIMEADTLQRAPGSNIRSLESAYSGVNSVFKIGPVALCLKARRSRDLHAVNKFADKMAVVGQVLDDLRDFEEDLKRKRYNYAAQFLLGSRKGPGSRKKRYDQIGETVFLGGEITALFNRLRKHLKSAESAIKPLELPEAPLFFQHYRDNLQRMENHLNDRQVEYLFNTLTK